MTTTRRLTVLRGARLFDGVDVVAEPTVVLDGDRVVAVGAGAAVPGADVLVFADATILPGLVDTHVHLAFDASPDPVGALAARTAAEVVEAMAAAARATVLAGVTTVRDLGDRDYLALTLRDRPDLPRIVAAGPPITTPGGPGDFLGGAVDPTPAALRAAVRERAERGCGVVKIMAGAGTGPHFTTPELRVVVGEAHRHGLPVTAHAHTAAGVTHALDAGVDGIEHASSWTGDGVADLCAALIDRQVVVGAMPGPATVPALLARLITAGARIVAGTDAGVGPANPHSPLPHAFAWLVRLGMAPVAALRVVTSVAAQVCGLAGSKGRLAPGFDADVLVVGGDPCADPAALLDVRAVYVGGRIVS